MRLFVAVWPPADVVEQIAALPRPEVAGLRWARPDQWHVTLRFLGAVAGGDLAAVVAALGAVHIDGPVGATAGPTVGRFGRRILHLPVDGLGGLAAAVVAATRDIGEPPDDRPFRGHLTLARATGRGTDLRPMTGATVAGEWEVVEMALVESHLGGWCPSPRFAADRPVASSAGRQGSAPNAKHASHPVREGPRYEVVERFSLVG